MASEDIVADIETDGLLNKLTKIHCIQIGSVEGTEVDIYCDALPGYLPVREGLQRLKQSARVIGHNFISFDFTAIEKLHPGTLELDQLVDTLVLSRMADPERRDHSLEALGRELGVLKGSYTGSWDACTQEMVDYARQDIVVGRAIYKAVRHVEGWG